MFERVVVVGRTKRKKPSGLPRLAKILREATNRGWVRGAGMWKRKATRREECAKFIRSCGDGFDLRRTGRA